MSDRVRPEAEVEWHYYSADFKELLVNNCMKYKVLNLVAALAVATFAHAQNSVPFEAGAAASRPTMQDMLQWKSDYLTKFENVTYLSEDSRPISEALFFQRVVNEKRGFSKQFGAGTIILRLLNDAELKQSQESRQ